MKEFLRANWKPAASVAFVVAAWLFVQRFPLTAEQRDDMQVLVLLSGVGAAALPGFRKRRRKGDPK